MKEIERQHKKVPKEMTGENRLLNRRGNEKGRDDTQAPT